MSNDHDDLSDLSTSARRVSASLVEGIHLRLDLFSLEFAEERRRVSMILLTTLALALAGFMVFLCVNAALADRVLGRVANRGRARPVRLLHRARRCGARDR